MNLFKKSMKLFAVFFGVGYSPKAPGTMGTLAAIPVVLLLSRLNIFLYMAAAVVLALVAIYASQIYENDMGGHDHPEIVVDEVVGFIITMTWLPMTWQSLLAGFLLFRLLDIWKPLFIGYLDKKLPGGLGVVMDDVAAGIVANMILQILYTYTHLLGAQSL